MGRLREMEMFVRVVEGGSFSAAARDLNMGVHLFLNGLRTDIAFQQMSCSRVSGIVKY